MKFDLDTTIHIRWIGDANRTLLERVNNEWKFMPENVNLLDVFLLFLFDLSEFYSSLYDTAFWINCGDVLKRLNFDMFRTWILFIIVPQITMFASN